MELTLNVVADVVMDEEELDRMLDGMTAAELKYLWSKISATLMHKSRGYLHADGAITTA